MGDLAKIPGPLSLEDRRLTRAAEELGDYKFITELNRQDQRGLRAVLMVEMARASLGGKAVNSQHIAKEFGVKPEMVRKLRDSIGFKKEVSRFILDEVLQGEHGVMLQEALRGLQRAVKRQEPWAIQSVLKMAGVLVPATARKNDAGGGFEDFLTEQGKE